MTNEQRDDLIGVINVIRARLDNSTYDVLGEKKTPDSIRKAIRAANLALYRLEDTLYGANCDDDEEEA
jgi:hypothetical protein